MCFLRFRWFFILLNILLQYRFWLWLGILLSRNDIIHLNNSQFSALRLFPVFPCIFLFLPYAHFEEGLSPWTCLQIDLVPLWISRHEYFMWKHNTQHIVATQGHQPYLCFLPAILLTRTVAFSLFFLFPRKFPNSPRGVQSSKLFISTHSLSKAKSSAVSRTNHLETAFHWSSILTEMFHQIIYQSILRSVTIPWDKFLGQEWPYQRA